MKEADFFNQLAPTWDAKRERNDELLRRLTDKIGLAPADRVLDLGSGTGVLLPYLAATVAQVTAVDYAEQMLAIARHKNRRFDNITYLVSDIRLLEPEDGYTKAVCLNFYPHITDKTEFVRKIYRILPPNGQLTIMHDISRQTVNNIHGSCPAVREDNLAPAEHEAQRLRSVGFAVTAIEDTAEYYFLQAVKK